MSYVSTILSSNNFICMLLLHIFESGGSLFSNLCEIPGITRWWWRMEDHPWRSWFIVKDAKNSFVDGEQRIQWGITNPGH